MIEIIVLLGAALAGYFLGGIVTKKRQHMKYRLDRYLGKAS